MFVAVFMRQIMGIVYVAELFNYGLVVSQLIVHHCVECLYALKFHEKILFSIIIIRRLTLA